MINILKKFYLQNYLKIVSIFIAVIFWSIADSTYNGRIYKTFSVDITIENMDVLRNNNYILENELEIKAEKALVIVRMGALDLDEFSRSSDNMKAILDLEPLVNKFDPNDEGKDMNVYLDIKLPEPYGQEIVQNYPSLTTSVRLGKYVEGVIKDIGLGYSAPVEAGYEPVSETIEPKTVTINGPKSYVDNIAKVVVNPKTEGITEDTSEECPIIVYDAENKDITAYLELYPSSAVVNISVNKQFDLEINNPTYIGSAAEGYVVKEVSFEPRSITVLGSEKDLGGLKDIELETIDITGATETITKEFKLADYIDNENIQIMYSSAKEVEVTIVIERLKEREISLPVSRLNIINPENESYSTQIGTIDNQIVFTVLGVESLVDAIDESKITIDLDLSELGPGSHDVPIKISMPESINVIRVPGPINVLISEMAETQEGTGQ
ncbi:MAG: hypothetical protein LBV08_05775 [Clostridiales bacterium]|jgi:YbbR domain-containing protein|nr:hypothetical protein [Clostridiales bacterium]